PAACGVAGARARTLELSSYWRRLSLRRTSRTARHAVQREPTLCHARRATREARRPGDFLRIRQEHHRREAVTVLPGPAHRLRRRRPMDPRRLGPARRFRFERRSATEVLTALSS